MLILLRHATPIIDYNYCNYEIAKDRIDLYNSSHKINTNEMDGCIEEIREKAKGNKKLSVYTSDLQRSKKTAEYIFKDLELKIEHDHLFAEFDLNIIKISFIKLPTKTWFFISRIVWFLGISINATSFTDEKKRARKAAKFLESKLKKGETIILVGHGLINKFIENYFKKIGFNIEQGIKNGCFEIKKITKK